MSDRDNYEEVEEELNDGEDEIEEDLDEDPIPSFFQLDDEDEEDIDDARKPGAANAGEYTIVWVDILADKNTGKAMRRDKNGNLYVMPVFEITDDPNSAKYKQFNHYLPLPGKAMRTKKFEKKRQEVLAGYREFCKTFNIDRSEPIDWEAQTGKKAEALLSYQENDDFGPQNRIESFLS